VSVGPGCVITGASSGIGREVAKLFLRRGFKVFGLSRWKGRPPIEHENFIPITCDLKRVDEVEGVARELLAREKGLSVLVNNAGLGAFGPHDAVSKDAISAMVNVNLTSPMILTQKFLGRLRARRGHLVFISSVTAMGPSPMGATYGATKAAIRHFAQSIFEENRRSGLKVHTILPDLTATPFFDNLFFGPCLDDPETYLLPEDIAEAVEFAVFTARDPVVVQEIVVRPRRFRIEKKG